MKKRNEVLDVIKAFAAIFVIFLHAPFPGVFGKALVYIGGNLILYSYILHSFFISVLEKVFGVLNLTGTLKTVMDYCTPLIVCVLSITASWVAFNVVQKVKAIRSRS